MKILKNIVVKSLLLNSILFNSAFAVVQTNPKVKRETVVENLEDALDFKIANGAFVITTGGTDATIAEGEDPGAKIAPQLFVKTKRFGLVGPFNLGEGSSDTPTIEGPDGVPIPITQAADGNFFFGDRQVATLEDVQDLISQAGVGASGSPGPAGPAGARGAPGQGGAAGQDGVDGQDGSGIRTISFEANSIGAGPVMFTIPPNANIAELVNFFGMDVDYEFDPGQTDLVLNGVRTDIGPSSPFNAATPKRLGKTKYGTWMDGAGGIHVADIGVEAGKTDFLSQFKGAQSGQFTADINLKYGTKT